MSKKPRESDAANPAVQSHGDQVERPQTDVESASGSAPPARAKPNSAVDAPNANDASVLPDEVVSTDDRTIPRASDLDSAGSLDGPDDMRDMTA